jgi:hypothetical protein
LFNTKNILCLFCFIALLIINGCSIFSELTAIGPDSTDGPIASDCGSCHVSQFREWSLSRHASAYRNSVFQAAYNEEGDEECLLCHAPILIRNDQPITRPYDLASGVDCISCHYSEGKMHGPHASSALFKPHPVEEKDEFYLGVSICARCHGETADEYGKAAAQDSSLPTCLACHATPVQRTASQGTNFFSDTLVFFEDQVETRSHEISLAAQVIEPALIPLTVTYLAGDSEQIEIEITNNIPHNLPTGTFGQKSLRVAVQFSNDHADIDHVITLIADENQPLAPGASKNIRLRLPSLLQTGDIMLIRLQRFGDPTGSRPATTLVSRSFDLPLHTTR